MISRRGILIGGGAGIGLVVAWGVWPRRYAVTLAAAPGEIVYGAYLKIGTDGRVTVAVPQAEHGQGVYTVLPQIVADELGADWRTVGVEAAPPSALYANPQGGDLLFAGLFDALPDAVRSARATRTALMLTAGSTSVRRFEGALREAGATARALLIAAAAKRWGIEAAACETRDGFVVAGAQRLRFGELAEEAAALEAPDAVPLRFGAEARLTGQSLPRLDAPGKVDGSVTFAADIRLPDMVFASVRAGPVGDTRLVRTDKAAADRVRGVVAVVETERWVAAVANSWWAANRALDALAPRFETRVSGTRGGVASDASIDAALTAAFDAPGERMATTGDPAGVFEGARIVTAQYRVAPGVHAAIEPMTATARRHGDRLELWLPTLAPGLARDAAAAAIGIAAGLVTVHPTMAGGSFGAGLECEAARQATVLADRLRRPVQLTWSRSEDLMHDRYRAPAIARMAARLAPSGAILGWQARIAAPATGRELAGRLLAHDAGARVALTLPHRGDRYAVSGAAPAYRIPAMAIDHHPAEIGVPTGHLRGGADGYTAFFTECFLDELAHVAGTEAMSYRIAMLGGEPRLARCLSTAAALGGWDGGVAGSGQGIACHAMRGSHVAVLAEVHVDEARRIRVDRLVAAVDCGRAINPDIVRQQIEGGLIFGMAQALGASTQFSGGLAEARRLSQMALPRLADTPDITVELIPSVAEPGGVSELGMAAVAPAIANAVRAATGVRLRTLPLRM